MKKVSSFVFFVSIFAFLFPITALAQEAQLESVMQQTKESVINSLDFGEINEAMKELYPEEKMDFSETVKAMINGEIEVCAETINRLVLDQINYAFRTNRQTLAHMLVLIILSAIFTNFSNVFQNKQIAEIGFYVVYMLIIALVMKSFGTAIIWAEDGVSHLTSFMKALCPVYFLAVTIAKGSISSVAFYNVALIMIFLIELLILKILLPVIHIYIMVKFLNCLSEEEYLSKFSELMESGIGWILKALLAVVIGLNGIQGLIAPAIDSVKQSMVTRGAEAIPGVGDALGGMAEVVLGTAVLVKNGIGTAGAIICIGICVVPVVQIGMLTFFYKVSAALIQPIADKRMVQCVSSVGEGCQILLKLIFTVAVLFLLTIAIVSATTGRA